MVSYAVLLERARRRVILDVLQGMPSNAANDTVLRLAIEGRLGVTLRDLVRADLGFLESHTLVTIERMTDDGRDVWLASLTERGSAVARGVAHPGVADRELS